MNSNRRITLKPSQKEEVKIAVPLIYSSGPEAFEYVFKNKQLNAHDFLTHAFVKEGGGFSYQNHYSLYLNDEMVGIGSIFDNRKASVFVLYDAWNIIQLYHFRSIEVIIKGLRTEAITQQPKRKEVLIANLGIHPDFRGKGLGTVLMQKLIETINIDEYKALMLGVSLENPRAKALYERLGFEVTNEIKSNLKNKYSYVPSHFRMDLKQ